ncbi:membrane protein [Lactococcus hodotermopsidis]|uniref:Membrane protein n=1 Tax=Pseudolactococcus hodotermopsidis TaxID=2709157 RepID=A0A6A0BEN8_9LACT|nr:threonine/serine exporter family protein [Lactococcus hodotermopsidis]GFH43165.1 membrane protein [Lactococcus hodotermopsidis]
MKKIEENKLLINACLLAGEILMANGSEITRVEDVIMRIGGATGIENLQVYALLNAITVSFPNESLTQMRAIPPRNQNMDMEKIVAVNDLTRQFTAGKISVRDLHDSLNTIETTIPTFPVWLQIVASVFIAMSMMITITKTLTPTNLILTGLSSGLAYTVYLRVRTYFNMRFFGLFLASLTISLMMLIGTRFLEQPFNPDTIIIGAVMPLVPGVALTNAVREIMAGNFISGQGRIVEALLSVISIGLGIALLSFFY